MSYFKIPTQLERLVSYKMYTVISKSEVFHDRKGTTPRGAQRSLMHVDSSVYTSNSSRQYTYLKCLFVTLSADKSLMPSGNLTTILSLPNIVFAIDGSATP